MFPAKSWYFKEKSALELNQFEYMFVFVWFRELYKMQILDVTGLSSLQTFGTV